MKDLMNKLVVITGAASGIGRAMAKAFAEQGARLALADINAAGLDDIAQELKPRYGSVYTQVVDVTKRDQVEDLCSKVYEKFQRVDVLCNNAGVGWGGRFEDWTLEAWEQIVAVNLWSVVYGCHYFYPRMIAQGGGGHIVNTASGAGLFPLPMMSAYCCTKFAVQGFSESLRSEAALHGIGVTSVCPGIIKTNIITNGKMFTSTARSTSAEIFKRIDAFYAKRNYTPDRVAAKVIKGVQQNRAVVPVAPETYVSDINHRLSRGLAIRLNQFGYRLALKWL